MGYLDCGNCVCRHGVGERELPLVRSSAGEGLLLMRTLSRQVSSYSFSIPSVERELGVSAELAAVGVTFFTLTFGVSTLPPSS